MNEEDKDKAPRTPADFRELLREQYEFPEEAKQGKRRQKRQMKKAVKQNRRAVTKQVIEEERAKEPMTAAGAFVVIVVILAIGYGATHQWFAGDDKPSTVASSSRPTASAAGAGPATPSPLASPSPSPSVSPVADLSTPEKTVDGWARVYLTRNPPADGSHQKVVDRSVPWMTDALAKNLAGNADKLWNDLVSNGGISTVTSVETGKPDEGLPVDTPLRVWRKVTVKTVVEGYKKYEETTVLQAELTQDNDKWRVSRVLGLGG
ncbi:hypothetical protein ABZX93_33485 [Streptomyces sp. NPDC006632]|uniref:hypothetical protein n=1 Tax=Streptomyces sp. NPDC006632 TaxID=3157182 RepID=UPI0033A89FB5